MPVRVEFFGVARLHAGRPSIAVEASQLGEAIRRVEAEFPHLEGKLFQDGTLLSAFLANINGKRFVSDPATPLACGDSLLILSADAGG
jgi:molybdopterin converting factor small subunit